MMSLCHYSTKTYRPLYIDYLQSVFESLSPEAIGLGNRPIANAVARNEGAIFGNSSVNIGGFPGHHTKSLYIP